MKKKVELKEEQLDQVTGGVVISGQDGSGDRGVTAEGGEAYVGGICGESSQILKLRPGIEPGKLGFVR